MHKEKTRWSAIVPLILLLFGLTATAHAQVLPDALVGGQVQFAQAFGTNRVSWCYVRQGASQFQRNGSNALAAISFPEVIYFDGAIYHELDGQARLVFSSATDGTVKFKFWGASDSITSPTFNSYTQAFNGTQYIVTFNILFPNNCTLPIFAGFENF